MRIKRSEKITISNYQKFLNLLDKGYSPEEISKKLGPSVPVIRYTIHAIEQTGTREYRTVQQWKQSHHNNFADEVKKAAKRAEPEPEPELFTTDRPACLPDDEMPIKDGTVGQLRDMILWQQYLWLKKYFNQ